MTVLLWTSQQVFLAYGSRAFFDIRVCISPKHPFIPEQGTICSVQAAWECQEVWVWCQDLWGWAGCFHTFDSLINRWNGKRMHHMLQILGWLTSWQKQVKLLSDHAWAGWAAESLLPCWDPQSGLFVAPEDLPTLRCQQSLQWCPKRAWFSNNNHLLYFVI